METTELPLPMKPPKCVLFESIVPFARAAKSGVNESVEGERRELVSWFLNLPVK